MKVEVSIIEDGVVEEAAVNLNRWPVMEHELRLIQTFMAPGGNMAEMFIQLVTLGIDTALVVYGQEMLKQRKGEVRGIIRDGPRRG